MFVSFKQMIYGVFFFFLSIAFLISNGTAQETITKEDFQSRLDRAFKLATQHVQNDEIIREIRQIFTTLDQHLHQKGNGQGFFLFFNEVIEKAPPYDGRIDSLVKWLRTLSVAGDGRIDLMTRQFVIPCETILMHPPPYISIRGCIWQQHGPVFSHKRLCKIQKRNPAELHPLQQLYYAI